MIWYCQHCGMVGGNDPGRCAKCGGPTSAANLALGAQRHVQQEPAVQIPPALAEVWLLRLAAMESHAESLAAMARAMKQMIATLGGTT